MPSLHSLTLHSLLAQSCGFISCIIYVVAYQAKDPRRTQLLFAPANFFYGMQAFLLLGRLSGSSIVIFASIARDLTSAWCSDKFLKRMAIAYIPCIWAVGFLFNKQWQEYMMCVTATFSTLAMALRGSFARYRGILFGRQVISLCFNVWIASVPSTVYSLFTILSNAVGVVRHRKAKTLPEPQD
jgi:hypothetical protein